MNNIVLFVVACMLFTAMFVVGHKSGRTVVANDCTKLGTTIINGHAFKCGPFDSNQVL